MRAHLASGIYPITDCENLSASELLARTARILEAGVAALQYRNKKGDVERRVAEADEIRLLCRRHGTPLIVNDDVELAARVGADGVHLGIEDESCMNARARLGDDKLIGISCYNDLRSACVAQESGADYVAFGAFFPTSTKQARTRADLKLLEEARKVLHIPIVAIGGITPDNAAPLLEAGADILAVVSSVYGHPDPAAALRRFKQLFTHEKAAQGSSG